MNSSLRITFFLLLLSTAGFSQNLSLLEDSMAYYQQKISEASSNDQRQKANTEFLRLSKEAFTVYGVYEYPFNKLTTVSTLHSGDGAFRIFNWNVPNDDRTNRYFCFVLIPNKNAAPQVIELHDSIELNSQIQTQTLAPHNWYGAIYYQIIPYTKKRKTYYTLLGWDGFNAVITKKVIETLHLEDDNITLGLPRIKEGKLPLKRKVFEYSAEVSMLLEYQEEENLILFDHLVPVRGGLEDNPQFYGPGVSFDAFIREDEMWEYKENFVFNRPQDEEPEIFNIPGESDVNKERSNINPLTGKPR